MTCRQCGREAAGEGIAFCPYCGAKIVAAENGQTSAEAEKWVRKALKITSLPERNKLYRHAEPETEAGENGFLHHQELAAADIPEPGRVQRGRAECHAA